MDKKNDTNIGSAQWVNLTCLRFNYDNKTINMRVYQ